MHGPPNDNFYSTHIHARTCQLQARPRWWQTMELTYLSQTSKGMLKDDSNSQWISPKCTETEAHHLLQAPWANPFPVRPQFQPPSPHFFSHPCGVVAEPFPLSSHWWWEEVSSDSIWLMFGSWTIRIFWFVTPQHWIMSSLVTLLWNFRK